jgi:hypothetical protein
MGFMDTLAKLTIGEAIIMGLIITAIIMIRRINK